MSFIPIALSLGFLGSFHCVGMCGPIALSLPLPGNTFLSRTGGSLTYNTGRVLTYSILGVLFGLLGKSFVLAGYQQALSITLGVLILIFTIVPTRLTAQFRITRPAYRLVSHIKENFALLLKKKGYRSLFLIGMLNGLLPCGLVYLGIAGAIATGDPRSGSLFMAAFGAGTIPLMLTIPLIGSRLGRTTRLRIQKAVPVFIIAMGLLLVLRGMNLGLPYLSPHFERGDAIHVDCCHKN